jgi:acyl-CoA hydrolase
MADPREKTVSDSRVQISRLTLPEHANPLGQVHGGTIMRLVDEAGAICAMRHARRPCVTVMVDSMTFDSPVRVGELVSCEASVDYVGETSLEVSVSVRAENPLSGDVTHTNTARVVYVALDDRGRPAKVPPLHVETEAERERWKAGAERHRRARDDRAGRRKR